LVHRPAAAIAAAALAGGAIVGAQGGPDATPRLHDTYGRLPLHFEKNTGQADARADYLARGKGYTLFLDPAGATLALRTAEGATSAFLRVNVAGANPHGKVTGTDPLPGRIHYYIGNDPAKWRTNIPTYGRVQYDEVYPGIDLAYYGNQGRLEYDFIVAPGRDPGRIWMSFEGARAVGIDGNGDLVLQLAGGEVRLDRPLAYQQVDGSKRIIPAEFAVQTAGGTQKVGFNLGGYDSSRPLVIDPVLIYSTFLGGGGSDRGAAIAVDAAGAAYVVGSTDSPDFPTTPGAFDTSATGTVDVFVTKLNSTGSALEYSTYLGGSVTPHDWDQPADSGLSIAVDPAGAAYVTGSTRSSDFPTTPGAFDSSYNLRGDAFVTKLDPTGSVLVYSTYLGSASADSGTSIAIDAGGSAYVTGSTDASSIFPTTPGAFSTSRVGSPRPVDAFVTKLNVTGSALVYSTYLGGGLNDSGRSIAVDPAGNAFVTGLTGSADFPTTAAAFDPTYNGPHGFLDVFVTALNASGSALLYSTFLGGSSDDQAGAIAVDREGVAYVTGMTFSSDFPTTAGAFDNTLGGFGLTAADAFVTKLNTSGSALEYSTYLGGTGQESGLGIAVDAASSAHVTGWTSVFCPPTGGQCSADFPTTPDAFDTTAEFQDAFVTRLDPTGSSLVYSTYLGGSRNDFGTGIALDEGGAAYVIGQTDSPDFPATPGAFDTTYNGAPVAGLVDSFVAKFAIALVPATLTLNPPAATNPVGSEHCVTATVSDAAGNPVPDVTVRFTVIGAVNTSGFRTTNASGQAMFCYTGPASPGADAITAFADTDDDNTQDLNEPGGGATTTWVTGPPPPPASPTSQDECKKGGYAAFGFKNQGQCIASVVSKSKKHK
jgi:hypothetical protein